MSLTRELFIGGKDVPALSGRTAEDISPYTGEVYATVAAAGPEDVTLAVDAADAAFADWAAVSPFARRAIFLKAADLLDARAEQAPSSSIAFRLSSSVLRARSPFASTAYTVTLDRLQTSMTRSSCADITGVTGSPSEKYTTV